MLIRIQNLRKTAVEVCGRIIQPRRKTNFSLEEVQAWIGRHSENERRIREMLRVEDAEGFPLNLLAPEPPPAPDGPDGDAGDDGANGDVISLASLDDGSGKKPTAKAVSELLGRKVTAAERDTLWSAYRDGLDS